MPLSREENIYTTKVAEQNERFEDMLDYIKKVVTGFKNFRLKKEICCQLPTRTKLVLKEQLGELFLSLSKKRNQRDQKIFSPIGFSLSS